MRIALAGRPGAGKTSLIELLSQRGNADGGKGGLRIAHTDVPDPRLDALSRTYRPRKTTPARIQFEDLEQKSGPAWPALSPERREMLAQAELVLLVFDLYSHAPEDWRREATRQWHETFDEFQIIDLSLVEGRLEKVRKLIRIGQKPAFPGEEELLDHLRTVLESGRPVRSVAVTPEQERGLRGYSFLSRLPILPAFNVGEDQLAEATERLPLELAPVLTTIAAAGSASELPAPGLAAAGTAPSPVLGEASAIAARVPWVSFCAPVEAQIQELPAEEQATFMEAFSLRESAVSQVIRSAYDLAGLQVFFTTGEDEVRAWSVPKGATAPEAAGAIHTDLERGFVRAEVLAYPDWERLGSEKEAREKGAVRLEGKEYIVRDGDILTIRSGLAKSR